MLKSEFMGKKYYQRFAFSLLILSFFIKVSSSQNIVKNGDFEEYSELPDNYGQINRAIGWNNLNGEYVFFTDKGSPDYHHMNSWQFGSAIEPISGKAQAGLLTFSNIGQIREYISSELTESLIVGKKYKFSFSVSNGMGQCYSNNLGAVFSSTQLFQANRELVLGVPQVQLNEMVFSNEEWKSYSLVFTAEEEYRFITIGNFNNDQNTLVSPNCQTSAYYFIDKVELTELNYSLCIGDSIELEHFSHDTSFAWALAEHPSEILSTAKTIIVSPQVNTTYILYTGNDTISFPVTIEYPLQSDLEHNQSFCNEKPIILDAGNISASFLWQDQSTNSTFQVIQPGYYYVEISNACGSITETVRVDTNCVALLEMPNVFTPNGDGINDLFIPIKTQQINNLTFSIYNRWGNQIAEIKPNMISWDGKNGEESSPEGVYFWLAFYSDKSGMQYSQKGFVQLVR